MSTLLLFWTLIFLVSIFALGDKFRWLSSIVILNMTFMMYLYFQTILRAAERPNLQLSLAHLALALSWILVMLTYNVTRDYDKVLDTVLFARLTTVLFFIYYLTEAKVWGTGDGPEAGKRGLSIIAQIIFYIVLMYKLLHDFKHSIAALVFVGILSSAFFVGLTSGRAMGYMLWGMPIITLGAAIRAFYSRGYVF